MKSAVAAVNAASKLQNRKNNLDVNDFQRVGVGFDPTNTAIQNELNMLRSQNETLLREKKYWMLRIHEDNQRLVTLFNSIKEVKSKLLNEIDEVQKEKDKLKFLQINTLECHIDNMLGIESELSESKRGHLPINIRAQGEDLYYKLVDLTKKVKANQHDVLQYTGKLVQSIEKNFLDRNDIEVEKGLLSLKNIASAAPGNIATAEALSASLPNAIINTLIDNAHIDFMYMTRMVSGKSALTTVEVVNSSSEYIDMKALQQQNEALKASLAQLRKRNAQNIAPAGTAGRQKSSTNPLNASTGYTTNFTPSKNKSSGSNSNEGTTTQTSMDESYNALQEDTKSVIASTMKLQIQKIVNEHPLSAGLKDVIKEEAVQEIVLQHRGFVGYSINTLLKKGEINDTKNSVEGAVYKIMMSSSIYNEVASTVTMVLTYLYCRFTTSVSASANLGNYDSGVMSSTAVDSTPMNQSRSYKNFPSEPVQTLLPTATPTSSTPRYMSADKRSVAASNRR
jgi:hypothetical protein